MQSNDGGALIKQIAEAFRDKEEVDALLEKEKKARLRAEKVSVLEVPTFPQIYGSQKCHVSPLQNTFLVYGFFIEFVICATRP